MSAAKPDGGAGAAAAKPSSRPGSADQLTDQITPLRRLGLGARSSVSEEKISGRARRISSESPSRGSGSGRSSPSLGTISSPMHAAASAVFEDTSWMSPEDKPFVFLGGSCDPTTWRADIAVPLLNKARVPYFNPQIQDWHPGLIQQEAKAKEDSQIVLFVIDGKTRAIASMLEATEHIFKHKHTVLVIEDMPPGIRVDGESVGRRQLDDLNRARAFLCDIASRHQDNCDLFPTVDAAVRHVIYCHPGHKKTRGRSESGAGGPGTSRAPSLNTVSSPQLGPASGSPSSLPPLGTAGAGSGAGAGAGAGAGVGSGAGVGVGGSGTSARQISPASAVTMVSPAGSGSGASASGGVSAAGDGPHSSGSIHTSPAARSAAAASPGQVSPGLAKAVLPSSATPKTS